MSAKHESSTPAGKTKKFGKGERQIPHHSQKAKKYYPAEDEIKPRKVSSTRLPHSVERQNVAMEDFRKDIADSGPPDGTLNFGGTLHRHLPSMTNNPEPTVLIGESDQVRKSIKPAKPRATLQPGTILILLAGRFRGKRVVLLKHLPQGILLVTGPFKVNGVPLRRVNARYVIATSAKVELKGIDSETVEKVGKEGYFAREKKTEKAGEETFFKQGEKPEVSATFERMYGGFL